jgi:hypothetical protein
VVDDNVYWFLKRLELSCDYLMSQLRCAFQLVLILKMELVLFKLLIVVAFLEGLNEVEDRFYLLPIDLLFGSLHVALDRLELCKLEDEFR